MKRSEAIKRLKEETDNWCSSSLSLDEINLILVTIEDMGMSPPDFDCTVFTWNEGLIRPPVWEPEE